MCHNPELDEAVTILGMDRAMRGLFHPALTVSKSNLYSGEPAGTVAKLHAHFPRRFKFFRS